MVAALLPWDTAFFGVRVGRVAGHRLTPARLRRLRAWCTRQRITWLYFLADLGDARTLRLAAQGGFTPVDVRVTLARTVAPAPGRDTLRARDIVVRAARPGDLPALRRIARRAHQASRFFADPRLPRQHARALYAEWIGRSCAGDAAAVFVAAGRRGPLGYVTVHLDRRGQGRIGLLGVAAQAQGQGIGRTLLAAAMSWCRRQGLARVSVVTQGRNLAAQRLYQRGGFVVERMQLWYHRWLR
jgi:dTDP-4-amino-4,6-dideoxy-D-galactose acyltransferase